jgi:hypothetical protein
LNLSDFAQRCGYWPEKEEIIRARLMALDLLVDCRRCKGSGIYDHNPLDSRCYGCGGRGKKLPPLTARLAATIRERVERGDLKPYLEGLRALQSQMRDNSAG